MKSLTLKTPVLGIIYGNRHFSPDQPVAQSNTLRKIRVAIKNGHLTFFTGN
jgi:hypothetical protein